MSDFLGKGPSFPLLSPFERVLGGGRQRNAFGMSDGEAKIRQSIELILATAPGERVMRPDFGCGIHEFLFEPVTQMLFAQIVDRVKGALTRWEPRVDVLRVEVQSDDARPQELSIDVTYRVRANNAVNNLVYPFYLQESAA